MLDPATWDALRDLGFGGLAAFALVGGFRGWYVWRREHDAVRADRDFWRATALKALGHADKSIEVTERLAKDA